MANTAQVATSNAIENSSVVSNVNVETIMKDSEMVATSNARVAEAANAKKGNFDFSFGTESTVNNYDNNGAYKTVLKMMSRGERLSVKYYKSKDGKLAAWIESPNVEGFKYLLDHSSYLGIITYLNTGVVTDFDSNPCEVETMGEDMDVQFEVMKAAIREGKRIQYTPLFREHPEYITAMLPCLKGKVIFRIRRTEEVLDFLRENNQPIY